LILYWYDTPRVPPSFPTRRSSDLFRIAVQPSDTIALGWGDVTPFLTYTHVGNHTQDQAGLQQLGSYNTLDFGVTTNYGENWELRSEEHTSELQSQSNLVCRLLLEN